MMKTTWRHLPLWSVLTVSGLLTACGGRSMSFLVTRPAEINLSEYDRITIGDIRGSSGGFVSKLGDLGKFLQGVESKDTWARKLSAEMAQAIVHSGRFELLDYENLRTGRGPEVDTGSTVLISGGILAYDYDEEETGEDTEKTQKKTNKKTDSGNYVFKATARVEVQLRIVDLSTSRTLATRKFTEREKIRKSDKALDKARIDNSDRRRLFAKCRADIVRSLERMIVPYSERVHVSFETDKEMPELEHGFRRVRAGDWDAALDVFRNATDIYSDSPRVHKAYYNLGMSCMYTDRFDEARAALREANGRKSSGKYRNAILELNRRVEEKRRLEEQRPIEPDGENGDTENTVGGE